MACLGGLLLHIAANFYNYFVEPERLVQITDISLRDLKEFPLTLQMTIHNGFDGSSLIREGYKDVDGYFLGRSRFNDSVIGWRGKTLS